MPMWFAGDVMVEEQWRFCRHVVLVEQKTTEHNTHNWI